MNESGFTGTVLEFYECSETCSDTDLFNELNTDDFGVDDFTSINEN